ncbi:endonuclease III domain-containing protein [Rufibacter tibetensis]|uniref:Endonuclease III n=1 Tax=Rufibacter tibetensis TaxID=512763 RepID=A0A0P0CPM6_9BACT|nr:endonuclease III [Rufibacter tibetensis]ALI98316.1 endonuclease III [Rufibacter tibetensis]
MAEAHQQLTPAEKIWQVHIRLNEVFGHLSGYPRRDPMRELISTMLSHRTTHANEEKAYFQMLEKFPTWEAVMDAPVEELTQALTPAEFPGAKAVNIQKALRLIQAERSDFSLDFLNDLDVPEAMAWLMSLPGVGLKTATLVLLFNFHKPVFPVDTHVHRISQRVGLIGVKVTHDKAHQILLDMLPKDALVLYNLHRHMLKHGQKICTWNSPKCEVCVLQNICNYYADVRLKGIDK